MAEEHFVSHEERLRSPRLAHRGGRASSPTHSAHGNLLRHSILKISENKKAKKVRFFRNGDRFFPGMIYAVSPERFRTFESLMAELTNSPVCDKTVLPNGVRHVFSLDTMRKVTDLDELEEGENYVCASTDVFKRVDYTRSATPCWNVNTNVKGGESQTDGAASAVSREWNGGEMYHEDGRDFIRPKLITVVRNGSKPRKAVRVLLNRKTAHSFNQVLTYITEAIKLDSGAVRKLYTIGGQPVTSLIDFFGDDTVFVAYGHEKYAVDDFDLDENEVKFVSAYCRSGGDRPRDRVTLRSPKSPRRTLTSSTRSIFGSKQGVSERRRNGEHSGSSSPLSPLSPKVRRARPGSSTPTPIKPRQTNGHSQEWTGPTPALSEHYEVGKVIGEGNFAVVRECVHRKTKDPYALKIIDKTKCKGKEQMIESEVRILRRVKHPNIILLVEEFDGPQELDLIMEFVKGGDLFDAIASATKYTERDACGMIYNLASALRYLHSLNIVHRDVKPENLLVCEHVDGSKSLKLGDFGLATVAEDVLYTVCGTPTYVAPEILEETGYGLKVDVWAAGIITYILLCGFPPFVSQLEDQEELFDRIMSGDFEFTSPFWDDVSQSAKELISSTLEVDPRQRYSAADVLQHPWVSDDTALDTDLHTGIRKELKSHFRRKPKSTSPGIALIASTALDKGSRYFQGRKGAQLTLQPSENGSSTGDEIF